jgi:hypothetical protein
MLASHCENIGGPPNVPEPRSGAGISANRNPIPLLYFTNTRQFWKEITPEEWHDAIDAEFDWSDKWMPFIEFGLSIAMMTGGGGSGGTIHNIRGTNVTLPFRKGPKDKTFGYLIPDKGDWFPIESGAFGPAMDIPKGTPGFNNVVRSHVEGHAAAYMRKNNIRGASLIINNDPCTVGPGCHNNLIYMLPEGARLRVYNPHTGFKQVYVGAPD